MFVVPSCSRHWKLLCMLFVDFDSRQWLNSSAQPLANQSKFFLVFPVSNCDSSHICLNANSTSWQQFSCMRSVLRIVAQVAGPGPSSDCYLCVYVLPSKFIGYFSVGSKIDEHHGARREPQPSPCRLVPLCCLSYRYTSHLIGGLSS